MATTKRLFKGWSPDRATHVWAYAYSEKQAKQLMIQRVIKKIGHCSAITNIKENKNETK